MFKVKNVVARVYDPNRAEFFQRMGIPTVASVRWSTDQVLRRLLPEQALKGDFREPSAASCSPKFRSTTAGLVRVDQHRTCRRGAHRLHHPLW